MDIKLDKLAPALFGIELALFLLLLFTTADYFFEFIIVYLIVCAIVNIIAIIKLIMAWQKIFVLHILLLLIMPFGVFGLFWYAISNVRC